MKIGCCIIIVGNISIIDGRRFMSAESIENDSLSFCKKKERTEKRERESFAIQTSNGGDVIDLECRQNQLIDSSAVGILAGGSDITSCQ